MPLSYAAGLLKTYISGAASYLMILWWACLTLVLRMVILRTTRGLNPPGESGDSMLIETMLPH